MEERPPVRRVAANILNKQSGTADKRWSSSLGDGRGANNSSPLNRIALQNSQRVSLGPGLIDRQRALVTAVMNRRVTAVMNRRVTAVMNRRVNAVMNRRAP
jgi:hypothetical protein